MMVKSDCYFVLRLKIWYIKDKNDLKIGEPLVIKTEINRVSCFTLSSTEACE